MSYVHLILPQIPTGWPLQNRFTQWWASPKNSTSHPNIHKKIINIQNMSAGLHKLCFWVLCSFIFKPRIFFPCFWVLFWAVPRFAPWQIRPNTWLRCFRPPTGPCPPRSSPASPIWAPGRDRPRPAPHCRCEGQLFGAHEAWFWVNYNDLTATSLESWLVRGIIPKWP